MSDLLEAVAVATDIKHAICSSNAVINNKHKRILKSKENIFKPKCNRELKKKLKKYKLRRDGNEDKDVLDVSQILVTSLTIKSPNNQVKTNNKSNKVDCEHPKPNNYLFKMVRRKKTSTQIDTNNSKVNTPQNGNTCTVLSDEDSQNSKQMDAFKLMMESRNKSIGSNSPGKEKSSEESLSQDILEKKAVKAKRVLSLQKMAENKGSLKKKEIEEFREKCIKKKMLKRAELFKDMMTKQDIKKEHSSQSKIANTLSETKPNKDITNPINNLKQNNTTLKLCDMFSDTNTVISENKLLKKVPEEDIEFLKKLSPSIRKKENMLCYFKTVSKDMELSSEEIEDLDSNKSTKSVIKVKFTPKQKKKAKTLKPSNDDDVDCIYGTKSIQNLCDSKELDNSEQVVNNENRKRKRYKKVKEKTPDVTLEIKDNIELCSNENRPKRNVKKPVKYAEDVHCLSSDEELHIFTPKKKRNSENCSKTKVNNLNIQYADSKNQGKDILSKCNDKDSLKLLNQSNLSNDSIANKNHKIKLELKKNIKRDKVNGTSKNLTSKAKGDTKPVKLAPIFVSKQQLSQEAIEAKQRFLQSGVPEKLKKNIVQQTSNNTCLDNFNPVLHVQQNGSYYDNFQGKDWFEFKSREIEDINTIENCSFKSFMMPMLTEKSSLPTVQIKPEKILKTIKSTYPRFPVYRTYHKLRCKYKGDFKDFNYTNLDNSIEIIDSSLDISNENPEKLNWCDKYKPTSSNQIIGNFESIKELKRWLETWSEKLTKEKTIGSDSSDMSDFCYSDMDSRDSIKSTNNILIVTGPTGCGKTSSVYAIAAELAIKVIEVNASSKRNGKIMLQDLQEATQSHKVNRAKSSTESSQKSSQEVPTLLKNKKRGRPKRSLNDSNTNKKAPTQIIETLTEASSSQEHARTAMSLILIDDADIVFDQDDGFCSAISQLIQFSKRPVILVTSSPSCPHLQKFFQNGKIIHLRPLLPRMLGTWLDIMCLADVGNCYIGLGEKLLEFYRGDIRKTINCLQFYMNSYKNSNQSDEVFSQVKYNIDDENSSMSWTDSVSLEGSSSNESLLNSNIDKQFQLFTGNSSTNIFNIWWNLANHYNIKKNESNKELNSKDVEQSRELKMLAEILNTLSVIDSFDLIKPDKRSNVTSKPWYSIESASLLESEDFDGYNKAHCINKEISNVLMMSTISEVEKNFKTENGVSCLIPSMSLHRSLFFSFLIENSFKIYSHAYFGITKDHCKIPKKLYN